MQNRLPVSRSVDLGTAGIAVESDEEGTIDFHALRHTLATLLASAGVAAKEAQELLRHSDPRLTLQIYTHTNLAALSKAQSRVANAIDETQVVSAIEARKRREGAGTVPIDTMNALTELSPKLLERQELSLAGGSGQKYTR